MEKKSKTKGQLAEAYGVHPSTFLRWLKKIPESILKYNPRNRIFTPKEVEIIIKHLGEP